MAVSDRDHAAYAEKLEKALQSLSDEGFNLSNMQQRGDAMILTASRLVEQPTEAAATTTGDKAN